MYNLFESSYTDPFDLTAPPPCQLINISTGAIASPDIQRSMTSMFEKGSELVDTFVTDRLMPENGDTKKSFYAVLPKSKVKTMTDMTVKVKVKKKNIAIDDLSTCA